MCSTKPTGVSARISSVFPAASDPTYSAPPMQNNINVQIAQTPQILRINRVDFRKWLNGVDLPANKLVEQISQIPNARIVKEHIGAGTQWATVKMWVIDIPLVGSLANFLDANNPDSEKLQRLFPHVPITPDPRHFMFAQASKAKNLIYEAQRREHTDRVRRNSSTSVSTNCSGSGRVRVSTRQWSAKHG